MTKHLVAADFRHALGQADLDILHLVRSACGYETGYRHVSDETRFRVFLKRPDAHQARRLTRFLRECDFGQYTLLSATVYDAAASDLYLLRLCQTVAAVEGVGHIVERMGTNRYRVRFPKEGGTTLTATYYDHELQATTDFLNQVTIE